MRKLRILRTLPVLLPIALSACTAKDNSHDHDMAAQLFDKSVALLNTYIDSLKVAPDSTEVERLMIHYDVKIASLNFEFPANTDLNLTEEENDSLIRMTQRMVRIRHERDSLFAHRNDSIPLRKDTVTQGKGPIPQPKASVKN